MQFNEAVCLWAKKMFPDFDSSAEKTQYYTEVIMERDNGDRINMIIYEDGNIQLIKKVHKIFVSGNLDFDLKLSDPNFFNILYEKVNFLVEKKHEFGKSRNTA